MPSMSYSAHGGPGYILSAGLLEAVSKADIESCVASGLRSPTFSPVIFEELLQELGS